MEPEKRRKHHSRDSGSTHPLSEEFNEESSNGELSPRQTMVFHESDSEQSKFVPLHQAHRILESRVSAKLERHETASYDMEFTGSKPSDEVAEIMRGKRAGEETGFAYINPLGVGGQGVVWRAWQWALSREVAVKQFYSGDEDVWLKEAFTTAELDHPNIVPVYDLSWVEDRKGVSHPLMAMKLIKGEPWHKVLARDRRHPDFDLAKHLGRHLPILLSVSNAISFAHSKGIIHRDLKPMQVVVGDYGEVFLMDWGLALFVEDDAPRAVTNGRVKFHTLKSSAIAAGTPAYMAPEQTLDAKYGLGYHTDVYLLGAMLYEIVTGTPPHYSNSMKRSYKMAVENVVHPVPPGVPDELVRILGRVLASRPKDRIPTVAEFIERIEAFLGGAARQEEAKQLVNQAKVLLGESTVERGEYGEAHKRRRKVENLLERALALWPRNSEARELNVENLVQRTAEEIEIGNLSLAQVHLDELAEVDISSDQEKRASELQLSLNTIEKRRKAASRQRRLLAGTVVVFFATALVLAWNFHRSSIKANDNAEIARTNAERAADAEKLAQERASAIQSQRDVAIARIHASEDLILYMLSDLQAKLDMERAGDREIGKTIGKGIVDYYQTAKIETYSPDVQVEHARQLVQVSRRFTSLGLSDFALALMAPAMEFVEPKKVELQDLYLDALLTMGHIYNERGRVEDAKKALLEAESIMEVRENRDSSRYHILLTDIMQMFFNESKPAMVREYGDRLIPMMEHDPNADPDALVKAKILYINSEFLSGEHDTSIQKLESLLKEQEELHGINSESAIDILTNVGALSTRMGNYDGGVRHSEAALERLSALLGPENPRTIQTASNLASTYLYLGNVDESVRRFEELLPIAREALGVHFVVAELVNNYGLALEHARRQNDAIAAYDEARGLYRQTLGEESYEYALTLYNQAMFYAKISELETAAELFWESTRILADTPRRVQEIGASAFHNGGTVLFRVGRLEESITCFQEAAAIKGQLYGDDSIKMLSSTVGLSRALVEVGRYSEAIEKAKRASAILESADDSQQGGVAQYSYLIATVIELASREGGFPEAQVEALRIEAKRILGPFSDDSEESRELWTRLSED